MRGEMARAETNWEEELKQSAAELLLAKDETGEGTKYSKVRLKWTDLYRPSFTKSNRS